MIERGIGSYKKIDALGKSPLELLLMVYQGAARELKGAEEEFSREDREAGRAKLDRARKFITHLYTTLDNDKGGDVAVKLGQLYVFIIERIQVAQATGDTEIISDLRAIIENLHSGWQEVHETDAPVKSELQAKGSPVSFVKPAQGSVKTQNEKLGPEKKPISSTEKQHENK